MINLPEIIKQISRILKLSVLVLKSNLSLFRAQSGICEKNNNQKRNSADNVESFQRSYNNIHSSIPFNKYILTNQESKVNSHPANIKNGFSISLFIKNGITTVPKNNNPKFPTISDNLSSWLSLNLMGKNFIYLTLTDDKFSVNKHAKGSLPTSRWDCGPLWRIQHDI